MLLQLQVLGLNPYSKACLMNTCDLSAQIMKQMCVADDTDADLYIGKTYSINMSLSLKRLYNIYIYMPHMTLYTNITNCSASEQ